MFNMNIRENVAILKRGEKCVFVDSFDNHNFDVRVGTIEHSEFIGTIQAKTTAELNEKLEQLVK